MTDVNALNGYTQTGTTNNTASQNLSADMNTFLTLLTTQLKYQDPLDPMDTISWFSIPALNRPFRPTKSWTAF